MRSQIFVPIPSLEETTGPNWMKFCMEPPEGIIRGITEGFLDIRSGGLDVGYPWGPRGRPKILKIFFLNFFSCFDKNRFYKVQFARKSEYQYSDGPFWMIQDLDKL